MTGLERELAKLSTTLPPARVQQVAADLNAASSPEAMRGRVVAYTPAPFRQRVNALVKAWGDEAPDLAGPGLALALGTGARAAQQTSTVDPVWTGPDSAEIPVRLTQAVLLELIESATQRMLLVSFAAYKVAGVIDGLREASKRGVEIRLILETASDSGGALSFDAGHAFSAIKDVANFWIWPLDQRPAGATLHAKAAIADEAAALVASANLTEAALQQNMELGLLVRGGPVPRRLARHFVSLMDRGVLVRQT